MNEKKDEGVEKSSPETSKKNTPKTLSKWVKGCIFLVAAILTIVGVLHQISPDMSITTPSPPPTPTIPTPMPTTPVTLGGKTVQGVVNDNNGNPVKGAIVEIDGLSAETGSDGYYVIRNVPINTKTITARAPGDVVVTRALKISEGDDEIIKFDIPLHSPATPKPTHTPTPRITASQALSPTITSSASPPATGSINVRSEPPGAGISFDGISIDAITPHTIPHVEPGKDHKIKLTREGYEDWPKDGPKEVQVMAGETTLVHANLTLIPGSIYVTSEPEGADIYLDNNPKEKTPRTITEVPTGPHTIKLTRGEYQDWSDDNVLVKAGETTSVHANLTPIPSTTANLTLSSTATPPGAILECPEINITNPKDGDTVYGDPVEVSGTAKNFTNDEQFLWACLKSYEDIWYPQDVLKIRGETWKVDTSFHDPTRHVGKRYTIVVLVATKEAHEELRKPLNGTGDIDCWERGGGNIDCFGLKKLPEGAEICDNITVVQGEIEGK